MPHLLSERLFLLLQLMLYLLSTRFCQRTMRESSNVAVIPSTSTPSSSAASVAFAFVSPRCRIALVRPLCHLFTCLLIVVIDVRSLVHPALPCVPLQTMAVPKGLRKLSVVVVPHYELCSSTRD